MSQSFDLSGVTHVQLNGVDCPKLMLNGVRIWERYTATRQVWVSSGYNSTSWVQRWYGKGANYVQYRNWANQSGYYYYNRTGYGQQASIVSYGRGEYGVGPIHKWYSSYVWGNWRHSIGSIYYNSSATKNYYLRIEESVTAWVDTSAYQTESYTAYYY